MAPLNSPLSQQSSSNSLSSIFALVFSSPHAPGLLSVPGAGDRCKCRGSHSVYWTSCRERWLEDSGLSLRYDIMCRHWGAWKSPASLLLVPGRRQCWVLETPGKTWNVGNLSLGNLKLMASITLGLWHHVWRFFKYILHITLKTVDTNGVLI